MTDLVLVDPSLVETSEGFIYTTKTLEEFEQSIFNRLFLLMAML